LPDPCNGGKTPDVPPPPKPDDRQRQIRFSFTYVLVALGIVMLLQGVLVGQPALSVPYNRFLELLAGGEIEEALIGSNQIRFKLRENAKLTPDEQKRLDEQQPLLARWTGKKPDPLLQVTRPPNVNDPLLSQLEKNNVIFAGRIENTFWRDLLVGWLLPIGVLMLIWGFAARRMGQGGGLGQALTIGKNRARIYSEQDIEVRFDDVAGIDEAKAELSEVVEFLKEPERFQRLGGQIPKGVLLVGPPGTGKTLLARAIAGEAGVPFFSISGSEFVEMFVGVGAARVRDLFEQAKTKAPCIIFIDELDAVGKSRTVGPAGFGRHDEQEQTLNQLLVEMDGFDSSKGVILLAASNRPEVLDPALLRAGRFDRRITIDMPDLRGRAKILQVHLRKVKASPALDVDRIAARTPGFSGADLATLVNEAALLAARARANAVEQRHFEQAADRLMTGIERRSRVLSDHDRLVVAHHESGHALVAALVPNADPVTKITIIPRTSGALGFTMQLPTRDKVLQTKAELEDRMAILLGGRAAEEICFGEITTGAHDDIERASQIARHMVYQFGMSDLGPQAFVTPGGNSYLAQIDPLAGRSLPVSEETARALDAEVSGFVRRAHDRASKLLTSHRDGLTSLAKRVQEKETLEGPELEQALAEATGVEGARATGAG
jgi:cell division protease FtsH